MGRLYLDYLDSRHVYTCANCHTHFVDSENLISKVTHTKTLFIVCKELSWEDWQGLFILECVSILIINHHRVNVFVGPESEKTMMTGLHRVCDIFCKICFKTVGWTYVTNPFIKQWIHRSMLMSSQKSTRKASSLSKGPS